MPAENKVHSPLAQLTYDVHERSPLIEEWFAKHFQQHRAPVYSSVDIRRSHRKIAVVDANLFPAGFNNLPPFNPSLIPFYQTLFRNTLSDLCPTDVSRILIIPENHTRNRYYIQHLDCLTQYLCAAGFTVQTAYLAPNEPHFPVLERQNDTCYTGSFVPDMLLLNNDLSNGIPSILHNTVQPILPHPCLGWHTRQKSTYFSFLSHVNHMFCEAHQLDVSCIHIESRLVSSLNLKERSSYDTLAEHAATFLRTLPPPDPYLVLKSNTGTYGMGVLCISNAEDITSLNNKERKKLKISKGSRPVSDVLIQEGIETVDVTDDAVSEPVVYCIGHHILGCFHRLHRGKHLRDNLNAQGAEFAPSILDCHTPDDYLLSVVARLGVLAAALENQHMMEHL